MEITDTVKLYKITSIVTYTSISHQRKKEGKEQSNQSNLIRIFWRSYFLHKNWWLRVHVILIRLNGFIAFYLFIVQKAQGFSELDSLLFNWKRVFNVNKQNSIHWN